MIEVRNLTKKYGDNLAVDNLSFEIEEGRIYGFLGPNGAGKSTTMNIITGCLAATSGQVTVGGYDIFEEPIKAKKLIGYLPEQPPLYMDMTPHEYLKFVASAKSVPLVKRSEQIEYVMEKTGLKDVSNRLIRNLSKGYKQRVGIAQAMIGDPEIIILDEPTVGLDPRQIIEIRELIKSLSPDHTVILSSHILTEIQAVCDYAIIISHGHIVASDTIENFASGQNTHRTIKMIVKGKPEACLDIIDAIEEISHYVILEHEDGCCAELTVPVEYDVREMLFNSFSAAGIPILEMHYDRASLEEIYLRLTDVMVQDDDTEEDDTEEAFSVIAEELNDAEEGDFDDNDDYVSPFEEKEE
ncbi:MAG: ABC transporter ATP-binding protein [Clostridia bacterium]|nr:ABC transporter ATP-binding protein [Clostridia bacterium]